MKTKQYWLLKTEAEEFSIDDLQRVKREPWSGVRNFVARNHLIAMKKGDLCFIDHTGTEKAIVGLGKVTGEARPDPTQFDKKSDYYDESSRKEKPKWYAVEIGFVEKFKKTLTLAEVKNDPALSGMVLAGAPRLSVQPVSPKQFMHIVDLCGGMIKA